MLLAAAGCAAAARGTGVRARLDEPFRLAVGQTAPVAGERLRVGFTGVGSDSRCPVGVQCIRAGEARVRLELRVPGSRAEAVILATEGAQPRSASVGAYDVHLVALEPRRRTDVPHPRYVATLRVTRR
jgi:hypothetical protein